MLRLMPIYVTMGLVGMVLGWSRGPRTMTLCWVVVVGLVIALVTGQPQDGFGVAMIPAIGALTVLVSDVVVARRSILWSGFLALLVISIDLRQTEDQVSDVAHARMSDFLQSRGMGRFLLWRFEPEDRVVVHAPGAVAYYSRRPVVDLTGRLHGHPISVDDALDQIQ